MKILLLNSSDHLVWIGEVERSCNTTTRNHSHNFNSLTYCTLYEKINRKSCHYSFGVYFNLIKVEVVVTVLL